jgi:hypothetical protein
MVLKVTCTWMMFLVTHQSRTTGSHSPSHHGVSCWRILLSFHGPSWQVPKLGHVRLLPYLFQLIFHPFSYPSALWIWCGKVFPVHIMKAYRGIRGIAPHILYLGTIWRRLAIFTPRPLHLRQIRVVYSSVLLQPESWKVLKECRQDGVGIRLGKPVTQRLPSVQKYAKITYNRATVAAPNVLAAGIFHWHLLPENRC